MNNRPKRLGIVYDTFSFNKASLTGLVERVTGRDSLESAIAETGSKQASWLAGRDTTT